MSGPTRVLYVDCPWRFGDRLPGGGRGAAKHYATLSASELMRFPLPPLADDCWLFLWRVHTHQDEAALVMKAWGFTYCSEIVWVKTKKNTPEVAMGMGHTIRQCHEVCLVGRRGKPKQQSKAIRSVIHAPRGQHSEKPNAMYDLIEAFAPGPYTELFARRLRPGWTSLGNEVPEAAE
jgi:N6-adenosine-specific RNA methylase IME4